jgi:hypothetical protein
MPQELKLLFEILRRWPGGYSFGEYLNAVEQHQIRFDSGQRTITADQVLFRGSTSSGAPRSARNAKKWLLLEVESHRLFLTLGDQKKRISASP